MKFKVYGWLSPWRDEDNEASSWSLEIIPTLRVDYWRNDFPEDIEQDIKANRSVHIFILFSWLIFGLTLDFRFGDDAKDTEAQ